MIYVFLADGFEEVEALAPVDLLRRAGLQVETVGIGGKEITGAHGIRVIADRTQDTIELSSLTGVVLPGGMPGTTNLDASQTVHAALAAAMDKGAIVGAICAAPSILGHDGFLKGKRATCFPGFESHLTGAILITDSIAVDGSIITAKGAGVAVEFGLALVEAFTSADTALDMKAGIQCRR